MSNFLQTRAQSFGHALRGWVYAVRTQRNAWIHVVITAAVVVVCFWLRLDARDWAVIAVVTGVVFVAEFLNTAIEVAVDLASPQIHPLAKVAKDVGAGAVLAAAVTAVITGLLILGPPMWTKISALLFNH